MPVIKRWRNPVTNVKRSVPRRPIWRTRNLLRCKPFGLRRYGRPAWLVAAELLFEPRDLWIGVYWTVPEGSWPQRIDLYICPLPTLVLKVVLRGNA
jgi:hypothetical protein